jgi:hypothetical protein
MESFTFMDDVMTLEVYFDEPYLKISWDAAGGCAAMEWKKFAYEVEYRKGMNNVLELLQTKASGLLLVDARKQSVIDQLDQKWSMADWGPRAVASGLKKVAILIPEKVFVLEAINHIRSKGSLLLQEISPVEIETKYFREANEAKDWLLLQE